MFLPTVCQYELSDFFLNGGSKWQFSGWFGTPKKRPPQTEQICSKTTGNMLLEVDLWGPFLGVANHQENCNSKPFYKKVGGSQKRV